MRRTLVIAMRGTLVITLIITGGRRFLSGLAGHGTPIITHTGVTGTTVFMQIIGDMATTHTEGSTALLTARSMLASMAAPVPL